MLFIAAVSTVNKTIAVVDPRNAFTIATLNLPTAASCNQHSRFITVLDQFRAQLAKRQGNSGGLCCYWPLVSKQTSSVRYRKHDRLKTMVDAFSKQFDIRITDFSPTTFSQTHCTNRCDSCHCEWKIIK